MKDAVLFIVLLTAAAVVLSVGRRLIIHLKKVRKTEKDVQRLLELLDNINGILEGFIKETAVLSKHLDMEDREIREYVVSGSSAESVLKETDMLLSLVNELVRSANSINSAITDAGMKYRDIVSDMEKSYEKSKKGSRQISKMKSNISHSFGCAELYAEQIYTISYHCRRILYIVKEETLKINAESKLQTE